MHAIDYTKLLMCGTDAVLINNCMHTSLHKHLLLASIGHSLRIYSLWIFVVYKGRGLYPGIPRIFIIHVYYILSYSAAVLSDHTKFVSYFVHVDVRYRYHLKKKRTQTSMRKRSRKRLPLRQFSCCKHRWGERVPDEKPQSMCNKCKKMREAIPKGEEVGVYKFICECDKQYTVQCRMCDTAECYNCGKQDVKPVPDSITFRQIRKKPDTPNKHSCGRCHGAGNCLNFDWNGPAKVHVAHKKRNWCLRLINCVLWIPNCSERWGLANGIECVVRDFSCGA